MGVRNAVLYVHQEPLAQLFLTAGIAASDIGAAAKPPLRHLLLLPPIDEDEAIDPHTGFNEITGEQAVSAFLASKAARSRAWLDYRHSAYLRELTPTEIAELLYLGHAKTHLRSPFYYKLQNHLVFLPRTEMVTMYFRNSAFFSATVAQAIGRKLRLAANEQPFWLRLRQQAFPLVPQRVLAQLYPFFEDGVVIDFNRVNFSGTAVRLGLVGLNDRFIPDVVPAPDSTRPIGDLVFQRKANAWALALK